MRNTRPKTKTKTISLRLSPQEYADLLTQSAHTELTPSEYLRQTIYGRPVSTGELREFRRELNAIGVNVNQLAKKANANGHDQQIYDTARLYIADLKRAIQSAVGGVV